MSAQQKPSFACAFYALLCIGLLVAALFFIDGMTNRMFAALFGLHFGNRSEIAALRARSEAAAVGGR